MERNKIRFFMFFYCEDPDELARQIVFNGHFQGYDLSDCLLFGCIPWVSVER
jgi:hypothetical protein